MNASRHRSRSARLRPDAKPSSFAIDLRNCPRRLAATINRAARHTLMSHGMASADMSIAFVSTAAMRRLHAIWCHDDSPTDVLTFDLADRLHRGFSRPSTRHIDAQIVVCLDVAKQQAATRRIPWHHELVLYTIHGCLHLCGYDDKRPASARRMRRRQQKLLNQILNASG